VERAAEFEGTRRRDFQRMLGWSFACHVIAVVLALASPPSQRGSLPSVIAVELVAAPPSLAPAPPKPAAQPAKPIPPPPPARPKPKQVVLPKKATQDPSKPKPAKPKPEPRREVVIDPKPRQEKSLEDLLSDMREEQGEPTPAPPPTPVQAAAVPGPVPSGGTGTMSPEEADWRRRAKLHVRQAWVVPPGFRTEPLETHVTLELDAGGNVVGTPGITRRSGNPWYDDGVVRGIAKASPLPPPPEAGKWLFVFVPEDAY
jgi:outer membrane biosynthesis protein TonB